MCFDMFTVPDQDDGSHGNRPTTQRPEGSSIDRGVPGTNGYHGNKSGRAPGFVDDARNQRPHDADRRPLQPTYSWRQRISNFMSQKSEEDLKYEAEIRRLDREREERLRKASQADDRIHVKQTGPMKHKDGTTTGQWTTSAVVPDERIGETKKRLPRDAEVFGKSQIGKN